MSNCNDCHSRLDGGTVCPECFAPVGEQSTNSEPLAAALSTLLADKKEQLVALPELREVTFRPPSRSAKAMLQLFKLCLVLAVCLGLGVFAKVQWGNYRHAQSVETYQLALAAHENGQYGEAEELLQDALLGFRAADDSARQLETYRWLAKNAHQDERLNEALAFLELAIERPELGDVTDLEQMKSDIYLAQGIASLEVGLGQLEEEQWEQAADAGVEALAALENADAPATEMAAVHRLLGFCQLEFGQQLSAVEHLQASLQFEEDEEVTELLKVLVPEKEREQWAPEIKTSSPEERASRIAMERERYRFTRHRGRHWRYKSYNRNRYSSSYANRYQNRYQNRYKRNLPNPKTSGKSKKIQRPKWPKRPTRVNATAVSQDTQYPTAIKKKKRRGSYPYSRTSSNTRNSKSSAVSTQRSSSYLNSKPNYRRPPTYKRPKTYKRTRNRSRDRVQVPSVSVPSVSF